jgi:hypothetical protein
MIKRIALLLAISSLAFGVAAQATLPLSAIEGAAGGWHAAFVDDFRTGFFNPAGFTTVASTLQVSSLSMVATGPFFAFARALSDSSGDLLSLIGSLFDSSGRIYAGFDLGTPIAFGFAADGFGFSLYNFSGMTIDAANLTDISVIFSETVLIQAAYAFPISLGGSHYLDLGFGAKTFIVGSSSLQTTLLDLNATLGTLMLNPAALFTAYPFTLTLGVGLDAGIRYRWGKGFAIAVVARNAVTPSSSTTYTSADAFLGTGSAAISSSGQELLPIEVDVGIAFRPGFGELDRFINDLVISVDYVNVLNLFAPFSRNWLLDIAVGVELRLLDVLTLRGGVREGLPAAGFGIDLTFMELSFALYGTELGFEPGSRPAFNVAVMLDFSY